MGIERSDAETSGELDTDAERVVYEVGEFAPSFVEALERALEEQEIPYDVDTNSDLVVYAKDESAVEAIFADLPDPDETSDDDGLAAIVQMTAMWHATGLLAEDPDSAEGVLAAVKAADALERLDLPFGFEPPQWKRIVSGAVALRAGLEGGDGAEWEDETVQIAAADLRTKLQKYV